MKLASDPYTYYGQRAAEKAGLAPSVSGNGAVCAYAVCFVVTLTHCASCFLVFHH